MSHAVTASSRRAPLARVLVAAAALLAPALACNDHALQPYEAAVFAALEQRGPAWTRPVDVLFVVDDSHSMCEEQDILQRNFDQFVGILYAANADFRLAVVTTDMATPGAPGTLRTEPGEFALSGTCAVEIDTSGCRGDLPRFLDIDQYDGLRTPEDAARMQRDFACMALAGTAGSPVEMGLGAVRAALDADRALPAEQRFVREDAILAIVVVSDENDCTDGTFGTQPGPVFSRVQADDDGASACELRRNVEDSCLWSEADPGPLLDFEGESRTAYAWCVSGRRDAIAALEGAIAPACPPGGCANELTARRELFDALVEHKGGDAGEIIFAAIINADGGVRYDEAGRREDWCGVGQQGYRYELFARMFGSERSVVAPICDLGTEQPVDFAGELERIAEVIRGEISGVCLEALPSGCSDEDGRCEGAAIEVALREGGGDAFTTLVEGVDYTVTFESTADGRCRSETGVPYRIEFVERVPRPDDEIEVRFARTVGARVDR